MNSICFEEKDFRPRQNRLHFTAHFDSFSGYGTYSVQVAVELLRRGYPLALHSPSTNEQFQALPSPIRSLLNKPQAPACGQLIIYPCVIQPGNLATSCADNAYMTMWETTRLRGNNRQFKSKPMDFMNACKVIIVPNAWNASCFSANGVDTPIRVVPLGIDLDLFAPVSNQVGETLLLGSAYRTGSGGTRKGYSTVVDAFREAFPSAPDVALELKCFPEDPEPDTYQDSRIKVLRRFFTRSELRDWYAHLNVFVSGSCSEGWGLHQHEAMAMGRPVVGINFGGVTEFFNEENGYACDWVLSKAEGFYSGMGHYAKPLVRSMAEQLRRVYEDRSLLMHKASLAIASARRFTIQRSVDKILGVLQEFKIYEP